MYEILERLPSKAFVLDLGCRDGSFPSSDERLNVVRVDTNKPRRSPAGSYVQADAEFLPFRSRSFDAVILNHTLEHFVHLKRSLQEVGRVVKTDGAVFVAVPDARTLSDRVYRKVYRSAGGHVNLFDSATHLETMLSWYFGLPHVATLTLLTSFSFLNRKNTRDPAVRAQLRFNGLPEFVVALATAATRLVDRWLSTRTSVYGWALYFGRIPEPIAVQRRANVCVRCGQAHPSSALVANKQVRKRLGLSFYSCPDCGATNIFMLD